MLTAALHSRAVRLITHPLEALALFVGSLYGLYFTGLFEALMGNHLGHVVMEFHFLAVGSLLFWAMPFHSFFSIALMSSSTVLAHDYYLRLHRPYWTALLDDQHLGGGIGWAMGELPILLVLAAVFVQWARTDAREAARFDWA